MQKFLAFSVHTGVIQLVACVTIPECNENHILSVIRAALPYSHVFKTIRFDLSNRVIFKSVYINTEKFKYLHDIDYSMI